MNSGNPGMSPAKILDLLQKGAAFMSGQSVIVAITSAVDKEVVQACLGHSSVAGVILNDEAEAKQFDAPTRIGYRFGPNSSSWRFPTAPARVIIVLGKRDFVGLSIALSAWRHGVTSFVFTDPETGSVWRRTMRGLLVRSGFHRTRAELRMVKSDVVRWTKSAWSALADGWNSVAAWWTVRWNNVINLWTRSIVESRLIRDMKFASQLRKMLRTANKIGVSVGRRSDTILIIIQNLASGGSERQAANTAVMLKRAGWMTPILVCSRLDVPGSGFYRHIVEDAGIEIIDLYKLDQVAVDGANQALFDLCKSEGAKLNYDIPEDLLRYLVVFLKIKPKLVHAFLDENNTKAGIAAVMTQVPKIVLSARSVAPDNFRLLIRDYMRPAYKVLMRRKEVIFSSNSRIGGNDYRRWLRRPLLKNCVVHNGVNFDAFMARSEVEQSIREQLGIPADALVIISVMRVSEEKQPLLWASSVIEITRRRADVYFILVGDGPMRRDVELMMERASVVGRVHFIPQTPDVPAMLRASDLFLLTSRIEGLPNVLIEAQAVGLPVVTTAAGGAVEALNPGKTGLVAKDQSAAGIADTCLTILDNTDLRARMGRAAPTFVRDKFSLERMFDDTMRLYRS